MCQNLQIVSPPKPLSQLWWNFTELFDMISTLRIAKQNRYFKEHGCHGNQKESSIISPNAYPTFPLSQIRQKKINRNLPFEAPSQNCKRKANFLRTWLSWQPKQNFNNFTKWISYLTIEPNLIKKKINRNLPFEAPSQNCKRKANFLRTLVPMATKWTFLKLDFLIAICQQFMIWLSWQQEI